MKNSKELSKENSVTNSNDETAIRLRSASERIQNLEDENARLHKLIVDKNDIIKQQDDRIMSLNKIISVRLKFY